MPEEETICKKCTQHDTRTGGYCKRPPEETHILKPIGDKKAYPVKSWSEIKTEAKKLKAFIDAKKFEGNWEDAYAISHIQVSREPKDFFVLNKKMYKIFRSWCVVNLKILQKSEPCLFPEACMSFMYRKEKRINRFAKVKVKYWVPFLNLFLIPRWRTFNSPVDQDQTPEGLAAFICQHESDHSSGQNIYGL